MSDSKKSIERIKAKDMEQLVLEVQKTGGLEEPLKMEAQLWDEILKKEIHIMSKQIFPLIKEVHGKEYPESAEVKPIATEYSVEREGKEITSIRADITVMIAETDIYHFELQMKKDSDMVIRMFEYDVHTALTYLDIDSNGTYRITFPNSAVLYLEDNSNIPPYLAADVQFQDGTKHTYQIPTMKIQAYSLEEIQQKHLTLLIPFLPLRFRKRLGSKRNPVKNEDLSLFHKEIMVILNQEVEDGYITEWHRNAIVSLLRKSMIRVFYKDNSLLKEVIQLTEPLIKFEWEVLEEELEKKVEEIKKANDQLDETKGKLDETKGKLDEAKGELDETNMKLQQSETESEKLRKQIEALQEELNKLKSN